MFFDLRHQGTVTISNIQLEQGSAPTSYEPFKSNILSTPEEIVLRSLPGGICDTLNLNTGEYVQRIGEIVLDGSESWGAGSLIGDTMRFGATTQEYKMKSSSDGLCDKVQYIRYNNEDIEHVRIDGATPYGNISLWVNKSRLSTQNTNGLKLWLQSNPITIQYELATPVVKTVDLTTVDQDNQPTKLGTFENVTHVSLESAGLIPEVEMEVATRISEELASASPLMDDISTKQEQLETTVDEQSNNVDATMIATTEIYEEIL